MIIETRHLRLISAIRTEGTLTGAAETIHLTQPAASRALLDLEGRLGVELFRREPRGMTPTPAGRRLLATADKVLPELARAETALAELRSGQRGILKVTTECYTCYHWVPAILRSFTEDFPGVDLEIVSDATRRPLEALLAEEVDLALLHTFPERGDVVARELFRDELVLVCSPEHPFAERGAVGPDDFADQHLVLHTDFEDSAFTTRFLAPAEIRPRRISELQLTEAVLAVVKAGLGISVMARWAVRPELERGLLASARLGTDGLYRTWYAAVLTRNADAPSLAALVDRLDAEAFRGPVAK